MGQKVEICFQTINHVLLKMMELLVEREFNLKIIICDKKATTAFGMSLVIQYLVFMPMR